MVLQKKERLLLAGEIRESLVEKGLFAIGYEEWIRLRKIMKGIQAEGTAEVKELCE